MKTQRYQIDTVQDCHDPADYVMVHKDYLAKLLVAYTRDKSKPEAKTTGG